MGVKKGLFFSLDAFLASMLLIGGIVLITQLPSGNPDNSRISFIAQDTLRILSSVTLRDLNTTSNNTFLKTELANGGMDEPDVSVLVQVGKYWARNETDKANNLTKLLLDDLNVDTYGLSIVIEDDEIFLNDQVLNRSESEELLVFTRMIAGIEKGKATKGSTASAYLRRIRDKRTASYVYFGGFVGQGNITSYMRDVPLDVNPGDGDVTSIVVEADAGRTFDLYINNLFCDTLAPITPSMEPDLWDVSHCNQSIVPGTNKFVMDFSDLNDAFIAGGYIKVNYKTDEFQSELSPENKTYYFPGLNGVVNLFDSFYVPGTLNSMTVYLHYLADHLTNNNTFYLTIGNTTVLVDTNSTTEQAVTLSNADLAPLLDYSLFSENTVPVRIGFENLTYAVSYTGVADVMLITDVSGSMEDEMGSSSTGTARACTDPNINDSDTQRLSVAKCLDKQFVDDILNITGNEIGLVSYSTTTNNSGTIPLTTNQAALDARIDTYYPDGWTCICCGINSARDELVGNLKRTILINNQSQWNYTNTSLAGDPPNDGANRSWYDLDYALEASWHEGPAILGHDAGGGGITTEMGSGVGNSLVYASFAEPGADTPTPVVEFANGYTSTANTYGIGAGDDGWDWPGQYDYDNGDTDYNGVVNEMLEFDWRTGPWWDRNRCSGDDCSGGYGISVVLDANFYNVMSSNGSARLSFDYAWDDAAGNPFEGSDNVWIKGRWVSPATGSHYLGEELNNEGGDTTFEIAEADNPDIDFSGSHSQEITSWIEGTGTYYLELGGKMLANSGSEYGWVRFDNILLQASNQTDHYYMRRHFWLDNADLDDARRGILNVLSDEVVTVYLNGQQIYAGVNAESGTYWDVTGIYVDGTLFRVGDNVIAVELRNEVNDAKFDLELVGINNSRTSAMMVMTDGDANQVCTGTVPDLDGDATANTATDHAIYAACDASSKWGIISYAVGFSTEADEDALQGIADCGNGKFLKTANISQLGVFYQDAAVEIAEVSRQSQTIIISAGTPTESVIYPDSYIYMDVTPSTDPPEPNEISIRLQSEPFAGCKANVSILTGMRVVDAVVTSYSGPHWTNLVQVDSTTVFNLTEYSSDYLFLGDPYIVQVPPSLLDPGTHEITVNTGDGPSNVSASCSGNNSLIYEVMVSSSTSRSDVVEFSTGCKWSIEFEDGTLLNESVPGTYTGGKNCSYTNASISYDPEDAYDVATYEILDQLDFDDDGRVLINLRTEDLEIIVTLVSQVPYLWGPSIVKAEVWQ